MYLSLHNGTEEWDDYLLQARVNEEVVCLLLAEKSQSLLPSMLATARAYGVSVIGGIFPSVIAEEKVYPQGGILLRLPMGTRVELLPTVPNVALPPVPIESDEARTALMICDGLSPHIYQFLSRLYNAWGGGYRFIGGGAGFRSLKRAPCVFTEQGVYADRAAIALLPQSSRVGVRHGWESLAGPLLTTATEANMLTGLNWETPVSVYQDNIEELTPYRFASSSFMHISRNFPLGYLKDGSEWVIRTPIAIQPDGSLRCVGEVPDNALMHILTGQPDRLIEAAREAVRYSLQPTEPVDQIWVFDALSRAMVLNDRFNEELAAVQGVAQERCSAVRGAVTIGQIASPDTGYIEFYNQSIVTGALYATQTTAGKPGA